MIIDAHTHIGFEDKLQQQTEEELLGHLDRGNVDRAVTFPFGPSVQDYREINEKFASYLDNKRLIPFGRVNQLSKDVVDQVERIHALGLKGVKVHTSHARLDASPPMLRKIEKLDLPLLVHTGEGQHASVKQLQDLKFSGRLIIGHGGKGNVSVAAKLATERDNFFVETSLLTVYGTRLLIDKVPIEKILLGSDAPFSFPSLEIFKLKEIERLGILSAEDNMKICGKNYIKEFKKTL